MSETTTPDSDSIVQTDESERVPALEIALMATHRYEKGHAGADAWFDSVARTSETHAGVLEVEFIDGSVKVCGEMTVIEATPYTQDPTEANIDEQYEREASA